MKIQYLTHQNIDKLKWDNCISNSFNGIFYAFSFYLNEVCETWDALVADDYQAVMPIPKKNKFGIQYSIQPLFCQQLGVFSCVRLDEILVLKFLNAIPADFRYIHLHLNAQVHFTSGYTTIESKKNYRLSLANSYENIQKKYNQNNKRNIKKAVKNGFIFSDKTELENILSFYSKHTSDKNLGKKELKIFTCLCNEMHSRGLCISTSVTDKNNEIMAMSVYFKGPNYLVYVAGSANLIGKQNGAMAFIMDAVIQKYSNTSLVLDFEGSEIEGIEKYFKGFGAVLVPYFIYHQNKLPWYIRWLKR